MPFPFFEASLRCLLLALSLSLGLAFLGENLAPFGAGDGGTLVLRDIALKPRLTTVLLCTSGGLRVPMAMLKETTPW
jgi:hypothetical protein